MTPARWDRLKEIFAEALEKPAFERDSFASAACAGDQALLSEVRRLLAGYDGAGDFLSDPAITLTADDEPLPQFAAGQVVAGRFRIVKFIARGGMGEVYEAEDLTLATKVALKAIHPRIIGDAALELFKQEILSARRVTHPNVCRVFDIVEHGTPPVLFLTMELLDGPTLSRHLRDGGPFSHGEALPLIDQICAGLQAAHDAGVIHRDFKSSNVMLTQGPQGWRPVITDFGLALPTGSEAEQSARRAGTPGYMAPEQLHGGPVTPATDVYALGVVIGRIIGIATPRDARPSKAVSPSSPPDARPDAAPENGTKAGPWKRVIERCGESDPAKRYQRPADVAVALHRSKRLYGGLLLLAAAALAAFAGVFWLTHRPPPAPLEVVNRRVWTGDAVDDSGGISPDGRLLSFTDWKTGDLMVHDLESGGNRRLTGNRPLWTESQYAGTSVFSRDGRWLAYSWQPAGEGTPMEVRRIGRDGSSQRTIYRAPAPGWLAIEDSSADSRDLLVSFTNAYSKTLRLVSVTDGSFRTVPVPETWFGGDARLSCDGRYVAYDAGQAGNDAASEVRLISLVNGADAPLLAHPGDEGVLGWSPDGSKLIFRSMRSGEPEIWDVPIVDGRAQGPPERLRLNAQQAAAVLGITRQGALYYATNSGASDVFLTDLDPESGKLSPPKVLSERFVESKISPAWSPDGSAVVYAAKNMLRLRNISTGVERDVQPKISRLARVLEWSRDGRSVFVQGFGSDGKGGTFRVDLETGAASVVLPGIIDREAFSHDARTIYTWGGPPQPKAILARNLETGKEKPIYTRPIVFEIQNPNLSLSSDGKSLALQLQNVPEGHNSLAVMPVTGGEPRSILSIPRPEHFGANSFAWSPDMRYIFAARVRNNHSEIWRIPTDGGPAQSSGLSMAGVIQQLHLNPNGRQFVFTGARGGIAVWVLENFLSPAAAAQSARR